MALRNLVIEGDPLLRKTSRPVDEITPRIIKLLDDMADTMYYGGRGIGIAAPQVGVLRRVFIVSAEDKYYECVNPVIVKQSGRQVGEEGCLSVKGKYGTVERPLKVTIKAQDRNGNFFTVSKEGFEARAIFHENDHLDGTLYIDKATNVGEC